MQKWCDFAAWVNAIITTYRPCFFTGYRFPVGDGQIYGGVYNAPLERGSSYSVYYGVDVRIEVCYELWYYQYPQLSNLYRSTNVNWARLFGKITQFGVTYQWSALRTTACQYSYACHYQTLGQGVYSSTAATIMTIGHVNFGIIFFRIGNAQRCLYCINSKSGWLFRTQSILIGW